VASIHPQLGSLLTHADGVVPTIRGPIHVTVDRGAGPGFTTKFTLPANMTANVAAPALPGAPCSPVLDGAPAQTTSTGGISWVASVAPGAHELHCQ
jgi:hypothetical protein